VLLSISKVWRLLSHPSSSIWAARSSLMLATLNSSERQQLTDLELAAGQRQLFAQWPCFFFCDIDHSIQGYSDRPSGEGNDVCDP
jgi:hypothetical protein